MPKFTSALIKPYFPGLVVSVIVGLAALFLSQHYGAPAMLFALLLGMALSFLYEDTNCKKGIEFTSSHILRLGVALLGLRVAFGDLAVLGWHTALLLLGAIISTIFVGIVLSNLLGLQKRFGVLTGGAVGICGASAAMAISAVLPKAKHKERDTLLTIIGVTAFSTTSMILYPMIAASLGLSATDTSIFLGGTIHDVAQVVGAGYSVSEQTGDLATLTKLVRVAFLLPVVLCILLVIKMNLNKDVGGKSPGVPGFLIAFVALMTLNSLITIPELVTKVATDLSRFALMIAIASIGMKSNLGQLRTVGIRPIILIFLETAWIAGVILMALPYL
ncbi:putative sulfate exporter family transporter [Paraglaciecola aquimarina]|uniref:Sulfate exporter family transporter n=1 Tax=Paraglaciecola algarum TaxID=3050085 RepID=A0ABS9D374_9ALTE|nr:putative sulfate exporter family transporter [Paraglaciecola sp. G1-23]